MRSERMTRETSSSIETKVCVCLFFFLVSLLYDLPDLPSAFKLVSPYEGDPPSLRLVPLVVTKKTVFLWNGSAWRLFSVALFDNCILVQKIGHFLLGDFYTWYNGMTPRDNHYIAFEKRSEKREILALVFSVKEDFSQMLEYVKQIKPKL
jgi:hypothetical protein